MQICNLQTIKHKMKIILITQELILCPIIVLNVLGKYYIEWKL